MKPKKPKQIATPWLLGMSDVCAYLGGINERTFRKQFFDRGLHPRYSMGGKLNYYHKDDVDKFLAAHNLWQEAPK